MPHLTSAIAEPPPSAFEALSETDPLREGLPFLGELARVARGDEDALQDLWIEALLDPQRPRETTEKGAQLRLDLEPPEKGAQSEELRTYLIKKLRGLMKKTKKRTASRKKLEQSWSYVTRKGDNGWP